MEEACIGMVEEMWTTRSLTSDRQIILISRWILKSLTTHQRWAHRFQFVACFLIKQPTNYQWRSRLIGVWSVVSFLFCISHWLNTPSSLIVQDWLHGHLLWLHLWMCIHPFLLLCSRLKPCKAPSGAATWTSMIHVCNPYLHYHTRSQAFVKIKSTWQLTHIIDNTRNVSKTALK